MLIRLAASAYRGLLGRLLPKGPFWLRRFPGQLLDGAAPELARVHDRGQDLIEEADPRTADELLAAWERNVGLPDDCGGTPATDDERRALVHARLTARGGATEAYFVELAARLGVEITVSYYQQFLVDYSDVGDPLYSDEWPHVWLVTAPASTSSDLRARLECLFLRVRPAHTIPLFEYV